MGNSVESRFECYTDVMVETLGHADRATPARWYLRGLMLPGQRKSVEPMAARIHPENVRSAHQSMHHLVADSEWSDAALLAAVAREVVPVLSEAGQAVAIDYYCRSSETGNMVLVEGEVHTIGKPNVTDLGQWVCPLSEPLKHTPNDWGPWAVRGIGVRARAAWVSPGRTTTIQDLVYALSQPTPTRATPSVRETWRQQVVDTYLTGAPI